MQDRVLVVAKERHESRPDFNHFHAVVKVVPLTRFLPVKLALRARHGLASHWSTSHSQLWSALRYITMATERKQHVDAEPLVWTADGRPLNLFEASQAPWNAATLKKRREARALAPPEEPACKKGKNSGTRERFGKMDLVSLILAESLTSPAQIMAYVQTKGSLVMQDFVSRQQRHLKDILAEARDWAGAEATAAGEVETDWSIVQRLARQDCACGADGCSWWAAAEAFFAANAPGAGRAGVDRQLLAATLRAVIETGPSKINRVPCLLGPTNSGKGTLFDPVREVFGAEAVFNKPKLGASCPLRGLLKGSKRFIYFDDYRPVEYARLPSNNPTVSVLTFLALFQRQPFDVQVSQSFHDGHPELVWRRGAAITGPVEGFWEQRGSISAEDVRHMQSRVVQFQAYHQIPEGQLSPLPVCPQSWCRWLLVDSAAFATRSLLHQAPVALPRRPLPALPESESERGESEAPVSG